MCLMMRSSSKREGKSEVFSVLQRKDLRSQLLGRMVKIRSIFPKKQPFIRETRFYAIVVK